MWIENLFIQLALENQAHALLSCAFCICPRWALPSGHRTRFDQCSPLCRAACKRFAVSTDRRKDREMAMCKMRWREKEGEKKEKEKKKAWKERKWRNRKENKTDQKEQGFPSVSLLETVMRINIWWWHTFYHSKSHSLRHFHGSRALTNAKEAGLLLQARKVRQWAHNRIDTQKAI